MMMGTIGTPVEVMACVVLHIKPQLAHVITDILCRREGGHYVRTYIHMEF